MIAVGSTQTYTVIYYGDATASYVEIPYKYTSGVSCTYVTLEIPATVAPDNGYAIKREQSLIGCRECKQEHKPKRIYMPAHNTYRHIGRASKNTGKQYRSW